MKQFIRIRLESIGLMENYWEIKSRLEVDGAVFIHQALHPNIHYGQGHNRPPSIFRKEARFLVSFIILLVN